MCGRIQNSTLWKKDTWKPDILNAGNSIAQPFENQTDSSFWMVIFKTGSVKNILNAIFIIIILRVSLWSTCVIIMWLGLFWIYNFSRSMNLKIVDINQIQKYCLIILWRLKYQTFKFRTHSKSESFKSWTIPCLVFEPSL